jgi:cell wall-associated NlpC family hydrolase
MASCVTRRLRTAGIASALIAAAVTIPTVAAADPGNGTQNGAAKRPQTIQSVEQRLGSLALKNDQLVERYNQATTRYLVTKAAAARAEVVLQAAQQRLSAAENQLASSAAAQYEGGAFSTTGALLSSDSGTSYLDQLDTLSMLSAHNSQLVSSFAVLQKQADRADLTAKQLLAQATRTRQTVVAQRAATRTQISTYKDLLAKLTARQRALWAARNGADVSAGAARQITSQSVGASSAQARAAVQFALDQVGKPYVFGAAGPDTFDCSGLTMMAWQQGGVSLPHSALNQYNYGHHVGYDSVQPGDLVFFYQPIAHVAIYIGDGLMVSAPEPGEDVKVVSLSDFSSDFAGATRLVG